MERILRVVRKIIPQSVFYFFQPAYHYLLALIGALIYRFPPRKIKVIAVTGTKGKSTVVELTNAILEEAGFKTAALSTIRFKVGEESKPNFYKMTTPGRFFIQKFLRRAVNTQCDFAVLEMTSEAARQFRHRFIDFDALVFTNLHKEHIESHGSYEKYRNAKLSIAHALENSKKNPKFIIANTDDKEAHFFLNIQNVEKKTFGLHNAVLLKISKSGISFNFRGEAINSPLIGQFNIYNILAAAACAETFGVSPQIIKGAIEKIKEIPGRGQIIHGKNFDIVVDYAHTPDSLKAIYKAFPNRYKICVLGNTGGGRDTWKRPEMGKIADQYCDEIILTNEDPYDENPEKIVSEMSTTIEKNKLTVEMDRRKAISWGIKKAAEHEQNSVVLLTGKGTDPFIMGPNGSKTEWNEAKIALEELNKLSKFPPFKF